MKCQFCSCADSRVVDSRPTEEGSSIRRRRECIACGRRFTTYEKIEMPQLLVIKKDNTRELFDAQKIRNGIIHACHKRPVAAGDIERIVISVEQFAYNSLQEEITTRQIGEMVMESLRKLDEVAYIRFASVYRQFTDIPTFMHEMTRMLDENVISCESASASDPKPVESNDM
jgi:transcriptional repressor NrdR